MFYVLHNGQGQDFNIRVSEEDYAKLKQLGSIRAREILLDAVNDQLFEQVPKSEMERLIYKYEQADTALATLHKRSTSSTKRLFPN